ncbi:hypothetical protein [Ilumatobacter sp.]|uniref:hypothetical protein n=1 Tax=Ilumatobacter sp. TaxID=1967498 RepID=UPI003C3A3074
MSGLTPARRLVRVNIVLIVVLSGLLILCLVRQLWVPAAAFTLLLVSNGVQLTTRRRDADPE